MALDAGYWTDESALDYEKPQTTLIWVWTSRHVICLLTVYTNEAGEYKRKECISSMNHTAPLEISLL